MGCTKKLCSKIGILVALVAVIVVAVVFFAVVPGIVEDSVIENIILEDPSSDQYERFENTPFALNFTVRFFDIANADAVMKGLEIPSMIEMGKLVYSEELKKVDLKLQEDNLLNYEWHRLFKYDPKYSELKETDKVTIINVPMVVLFQIIENISEEIGFLGTLLTWAAESGCPEAFIMPKGTVFRQGTVGEYAMGNYTFCKKETKGMIAKIICDILRNVQISETLQKDEEGNMVFSFFKYKHGAVKGNFEVESGINDIDRLGQIERWGGSKRINTWNEDGNCNDIAGTDTTIYAPFNDKATIFTVFNTDVCRKIKLAFSKEIEYMDVPGYQSDIHRSNLDWSLDENKCYCILKARTVDGKRECLPSGFMDMTECVGAPLILSYPHFLWEPEDSEYPKTVKGMNPVEDDHKIFVKMEPNTGTPLEGHKRVQFNIGLRNYVKGKVGVTKNVKNALLPLFWIDESAEIPDHLVQIVKDQYFAPVNLVTILQWSLVGVSAFCLVFFIGCYLCVRRQKQSENEVKCDKQ